VSTWAYDSLGRLTSSSDGTSIAYEYNLADQVTKIVYPGSHDLVRSYDDAGRLASSVDWNSHTTTFDYDENANLVEVVFPTGSQVDTYSYDHADGMDTVAMMAGVHLRGGLDYTRDDNGQLTAEDLTTLPGSDTTWGYDNVERLTDRNSSTTWAYDNADNLTLTSTGAVQIFNAANQLCSTAPTAGTCASPAVGATTYSFDARGNRTTKTPPSPAGPTAYTYDQANRLTAVDTASAAYAYNADGLRTTKTVSGTTTTFVWDKAAALPLLLRETEASNDTYYLYGPGDVPYAQIADDTTTTTYLHHDQLGSIRLLTNGSGVTTGAATYDAYGTVTASSGTLSHLGYAGQYTDPETGFQYLRARYYDPATAQFLTRDPADAVTRSAYGYVNGSPLNGTDPSGLACGAGPGVDHQVFVLPVSGRGPKLSAAEQEALDNYKDGIPYDPKVYKQAKRKQQAQEKYDDERNAGKERGQPKKSVVVGGGLLAGAAAAWWAAKVASPACGPLAPVCLVVL